MNVLVFLSGVSDPKVPLGPIQVSPEGLLAELGQSKRTLSPFDEAALEVALKMRDKNPAVRVAVFLVAGANNDFLLKAVAAYRPDQLNLLDLSPFSAWDASALAQRLAATIAAANPTSELVLIGREFGDCDDGSLAPYLASTLSWNFLPLAQEARWDGGQLLLMREQGATEESVQVSAPFLASITNDRRNRLRHPLLKNVMAARKETFSSVEATPVGEVSRIRLRNAGPAHPPSRHQACHMLSGDLPAQARELAAILLKGAQGS